MADKSLFWADQIADQIIKRVKEEKVLQDIVKKNGYIIYDEKTPSGIIHIGSGRGWIIHDTIAKALRDKGVKAKFILSSDDIDPFDKVPGYLDKEKYQKYLGIPFRNIPSPVKGYKSFADYYFSLCTEKFREFGIDAELESTGERYINGDFNKTIKISLDNHEKINAIFERVYGKPPKRKYQFNPICEKCGNISSTEVTEWNPETEKIRYQCTNGIVDWADGCGHQGEMNPYNGNGKLPWKVEWAAKWPTVGVVYETAGKDHFTKGGSRTIAIAVADELFDFPPPLPSSRTKEGKGYEFFNIGGKKMSTSKGRGVGFVDSTNYAPANMLRYLLVGSRPSTAIDFDPNKPDTLILLYDQFDYTERVYFGEEKTQNKKEIAQQKRIYELSQVEKIPKSVPPQISLTHAAMVTQTVGDDIERAIKVLQKTGHVGKKITKEDREYLKNRLAFAKKWVQEFASEDYRYEIHEEKDFELGQEEKDAIKILLTKLNKDFNQDDLYEIGKATGMKGKFFALCYKILLRKQKGPRLFELIQTMGTEKAKEIFEKYV